MIIIVTDTETTGLIDFKKEITDPSQPHIVQLAAILAHDTGEIIETFDCLIKPEGYIIPEAETDPNKPKNSTNIHGITHARAESEGIRITDALKKLDEMAAKAESHIAHNISFDMAMINREALSLNIETIIRQVPRFCTMKESTDLCCLPKAKGYGFKWPTLTELHLFLFGEKPQISHNALEDAKACLKSFAEMLKRGFINLNKSSSDKPQAVSEMPTV